MKDMGEKKEKVFSYLSDVVVVVVVGFSVSFLKILNSKNEERSQNSRKQLKTLVIRKISRYMSDF